jgi:hypothetical protein
MLAGDEVLTTAILEDYMRKAEFRPPDRPEDG